MRTSITAVAAAALIAGSTSPAAAAENETVTLTPCQKSYGTIAVVEGDTQGRAAYGLGSPRELINALALESACFTPRSAASGKAAASLMKVSTGDSHKEEKSI